jgi:hypothetical protein
MNFEEASIALSDSLSFFNPFQSAFAKRRFPSAESVVVFNSREDESGPMML